MNYNRLDSYTSAQRMVRSMSAIDNSEPLSRRKFLISAVGLAGITACGFGISATARREAPLASVPGYDHKTIRFFSTFGVPDGLFRSSVSSLQEMLEVVHVVVEAQVVDVVEIATQSSSEESSLRTFGFVLSTSTPIAGKLSDRAQERLVVAAGATSGDSDGYLNEIRSQLPTAPVVWLLGSIEKTSEKLNAEAEGRGETVSTEPRAEQDRFKGVYNVSPYGVIAQGKTHVEVPMVDSDERGALAESVEAHRSLADIKILAARAR